MGQLEDGVQTHVLELSVDTLFLTGVSMRSSEAALFTELRTAGLTEKGGLKTQSRPSFEQETQESSPSSLKHLIFRRRHSLQALGDLPRFFGVGEEESGVDGERACSCEIATGRFRRGVPGATLARGSLELGRFQVGRAVLAWLGSRLRTGLDSASCEKYLLAFSLPD